MARFYSNENFPRRAVQALRELGHEVLTSLEAGRANKKIPDDEVLQFAKDEERILLTMNRKDFFRLHRNSDAAHAGIVACTQNPDPQALAGDIHEVAGTGSCAGKFIKVIRKDRRKTTF
jgi:predicted nuclease of predicted toxin-antitoxin system